MPHDGDALWEFLSDQDHLAERVLSTPDAHVPLSDLAHGSSLGAPLEEFSDRSVLIATRGQLAAALALIELSGVNMFKVKHGRVVEQRAELDFFGLLQQIGAIPLA